MAPLLRRLSMAGNKIQCLGEGNIGSVKYLGLIIADAHSTCCIAENLQHCVAPYNDIFTTCEDLLGSLVLRYVVWLTCFGGLTTNVLVLIVRVLWFKKTDVENFLVLNLSLADNLSSIYLFFLSIYDVKFRGYFIAVAYIWKNSALCKSMSIVATVSANMSLFTVVLITMMSAKGILGQSTFKMRTLILLMSFGWIVHIVLPLLSHVISIKSTLPLSCLLFTLSSQKLQGWQYNFLALTLTNIIPFSGITLAYILIVSKVLSARRRILMTGSVISGAKRTISVSINVIILVASNLIVWIPILALSMVSVLASVNIPPAISRYT